eukprot:CAMPEP_0174341524 /NCGR_PEP_ID=MMETSP0810-20121108/25496_1 /TAXON_ID=73025 ORGANISM="Eutreptiella gymnastica-like, Strain CCMP1594" /NCGR_SAMPLE_ID=MMETSP0810 /ASSEMBLY_ACC=CAM_ASM_000659 /LENGTH=114 /DNA_ID=CAMNT_0015463243 /DNA_START=183 /DNA_END=527 /DNA_ORIENTATION=+
MAYHPQFIWLDVEVRGEGVQWLGNRIISPSWDWVGLTNLQAFLPDQPSALKAPDGCALPNRVAGCRGIEWHPAALHSTDLQKLETKFNGIQHCDRDRKMDGLFRMHEKEGMCSP